MSAVTPLLLVGAMSSIISSCPALAASISAVSPSLFFLSLSERCLLAISTSPVNAAHINGVHEGVSYSRRSRAMPVNLFVRACIKAVFLRLSFISFWSGASSSTTSASPLATARMSAVTPSSSVGSS
ncbi:Hypothetical protein GL50581_2746 [Giardia duodenalis ATCC 50581]|uniref:Secreted protein n=1 Tax=Giardia intestinalis (strain ATCC 50581 / GS clone H7) TaxID=598745 RepID=C6LVE0_GIAIB|nr:Hypothetical protein GL50581_2746 [Giardia intestinalis ATCC 50581]